MRNTALLAIAVIFAGMGVLVDFASILLSMISDLLLIGAAGTATCCVLREQRTKIHALEAELVGLRLAATTKAPR